MWFQGRAQRFIKLPKINDSVHRCFNIAYSNNPSCKGLINFLFCVDPSSPTANTSVGP